jgi:hypothetical protein
MTGSKLSFFIFARKCSLHLREECSQEFGHSSIFAALLVPDCEASGLHPPEGTMI